MRTSLTLDRLAALAAEFDELGEGERYAAADFAEWIRLELVAGTRAREEIRREAHREVMRRSRARLRAAG